MPDRLITAALGLALMVGASGAQDEKAAKKVNTFTGTIAKVDPSGHELHVTPAREKKVRDALIFKIGEKTQFVFYTATGEKKATGRAAYKEKALKEGAQVEVDEEVKGVAKEVRVGKRPAKKRR